MNARRICHGSAADAGRADAGKPAAGRGVRRRGKVSGSCLTVAVLGIAGVLPIAAHGFEPALARGAVVIGSSDGGGTETFDSVLLQAPGSAVSEATIGESPVVDDGVMVTDEGGANLSGGVSAGEPMMFDEGLQMPYPGRHHCRQCCGPLWSVQVDALMLWRSNMQSMPLFLDSLGGVALDANQVQPPMSAGPRVGVIRHIGPCAAIEGNYFNVSPFAGQSVTPAEGAPFTMTNFGDLVFDDITVARLSSGARIQSAEFNWRRSIGPAITWLAGFRWVQWNEQMDATYWFVDSNPYNLGSGSTTASVGNDLYGGQVGVDAMLWDRGGRWKVSGLAKAGLFYDVAYQKSTAGFVPLSGDPYALPMISAADTDVAFFGEVGLNSIYWLKSWLAWRVGYSLFWLDGVAVAAQQFPLASYGSGTTTINTNGSVFLHGVTTGLEARW